MVGGRSEISLDHFRVLLDLARVEAVTKPTADFTKPEPFEAILHDLDEVILPGITHWQHPNFFGYFPSNGELSAVLGDYLSTGLGVLGLSWQSSPALTELEEVVTDWMRQMLGLSEAWSGVIQDTASTSTLVALLCARERTSNYSLVRGGLQSEAHPLVVYVSRHSHSSVEKAALLAGFGRVNLRYIATDDQYAMEPAALEEAIRAACTAPAPHHTRPWRFTVLTSEPAKRTLLAAMAHHPRGRELGDGQLVLGRFFRSFFGRCLLGFLLGMDLWN